MGFGFVVEAGLGRGHQDFRAICLYTLPASRSASQIWRSAQAEDQVEDRPAYKGMLSSGALDRCGVTLLAGKAVGAPFVGAVAATLALSEVRLLHGGAVHELIDLDLKAPDYRSVVLTQQDFSALNPGFTTRSRPRAWQSRPSERSFLRWVFERPRNTGGASSTTKAKSGRPRRI